MWLISITDAPILFEMVRKGLLSEDGIDFQLQHSSSINWIMVFEDPYEGDSLRGELSDSPLSKDFCISHSRISDC